MYNTCCNFDEWESRETHFKVQLLSFFSSFNFVLPHPLLSLFFSSIEASSLSFLSRALSCWWISFFHGLFPSGWRLLSPLLLYLPLHLHGEKSPLKDLIEAQRSSLHRSFSSKLPSHNILMHNFVEIKSSCWLLYSVMFNILFIFVFIFLSILFLFLLLLSSLLEKILLTSIILDIQHWFFHHL